MTRGKKIFLIIFLLVCALGGAFFAGWLQLAVKPGKVGVMVSKTSGVHETVVENGKFNWRPERLLPTNTEIRNFDIKNIIINKQVTGILPSHEILSNHVDGNGDWDYSFSVDFSVSVTPGELVELVRLRDFKNQDEFVNYLGTRLDVFFENLVEYIISQSKDIPVQTASLDQEEIDMIVSRDQGSLAGITVNAVDFISCKLPDIYMYNIARNNFEGYMEVVKAKMLERADEQALKILEQDRIIEQLEKFGKLLQKYPELDELSKIGNINEIIKTLRNKQ